MGPASDAELVARVLRSDDRGAFGRLVHRNQAEIRNLLRKLTCGDWALADDLAQDTFVKAYLKLATFRGEAGFSTWLYRIAYNTFLASRRGKAVRTEVVSDEKAKAARAQVEALRTGPADRTALAVDLERAMAHLNEVQRAALALCYAGGLSHSEAAGVLDLPVGTLKTHILRAKEKLRPRLSAWNKEQRNERHG